MGIFDILSLGNNKWTFMVSDARLRSNRVVNQSTISENFLVGKLRQLQLVGKRKFRGKGKITSRERERERESAGIPTHAPANGGKE